ncbi:hypothetical protein [Bacteroides sp. 51]|uniref:hypothetical protein n=1 Tax=Bacteroides sp. 51 TaxID=2302938 RepID=UPI0013D7F5B6|nr:hypothetical protein [Bacteroides sp. 51]
MFIEPKRGVPYWGWRYFIPSHHFVYYIYEDDRYRRGTNEELVEYVRSKGR